jgi:hypothetical protein
MPVNPTYPGVYIEEIPSGVRTIMGVSTSVASFIGYFKKGPMNKPVQIFNIGELEREFGGLDSSSEASYAIQQFFLNGGQEAWVVRTASGAVAKANVNILGGIGGATALTVEAISEGQWGNHLRVSIDHNSSDPDTLFNLFVSEYTNAGGFTRLVSSEVFRNLSMVSSHARFVEKVVNDETSGSHLIRVRANGSTLPLQNGTVSGDLSAFPTLTATSPAVNVTIDTEGPFAAEFSKAPTTLEEARTLLEAAIRSSKPDNSAFASASVEIIQKRLRILAGSNHPGSRIIFGPSGSDPTVTELQLDSAAVMTFQGLVSDDLSTFPTLTVDPGSVDVTIGTEGPHTASFTSKPTNLTTARTRLEDAIRNAHSSLAFTEARVIAYSHGGDSRLIVIPGIAGVAVSFTAATGDSTTLTELGLDNASAMAVEGVVSGDLSTFPSLTTDPGAINVTIGGEGPHLAAFTTRPTSVTTARTQLEDAIRAAHANPAFTGARVGAYTFGGQNRLVVIAGITGNAVLFSAAPTDLTTVSELKLDATNGAVENVQEYTLGASLAIPDTAQGAGVLGNDGSPPDGTALIGDLNSKTGIYALEDVDLFNILCIPRTAMVSTSNPHALSKSEAFAVMAVANRYCEKRRAFFVIDTPDDVDDVQEIKDWLDGNATLRHENSAIYFPRLRVPDSLNDFRLRSFGGSGTVAGLFARTDSTRGVWKAPAGTDAVLVNVQGLDYTMTDEQNGTLNPQGINCIRNFPVYGTICWGARTLRGADQLTSEWKYISVRRLALYIEESLYRGTQWVVFEPND